MLPTSSFISIPLLAAIFRCSHALQTAPPTSSSILNHADITWKLRPPPEMPWFQQLQYTIGGPLIRLQCKLSGEEPPRLLFPNAPSVVLEAWLSKEKIGRFGCTVTPGPTTPALLDVVGSLYGQTNRFAVPTGAIIYMFVEPTYRGRGVGRLALETIGVLQAAKGCDFTVLVADDKDTETRKLVRWYESHGFSCAPSLQEMLGSPDGKYGIAMIGPTPTDFPKDCVVQWW